MAKELPAMNLFSIVEDAYAVIKDKGIYRQVELYERGESLYAAYRGGFARLIARGSTSVPNVKWGAIEGIAYREEISGPQANTPQEKATGVAIDHGRRA